MRLTLDISPLYLYFPVTKTSIQPFVFLRYFFKMLPHDRNILIFAFFVLLATGCHAAQASVSSGPSSKEAHYIFATGPSLYDPTKVSVKRWGKYTSTGWSRDQNSSYAKKRISWVGERILRENPSATVEYLTTLNFDALRNAFDSYDSKGASDRIVLVISAHGGISQNQFSLVGDKDEKILNQSLNEIFDRTRANIELVLLTCNSHAYRPPSGKSISVFGASPQRRGGKMNAADFYDLLQNLDIRKKPVPSTASGFYDSYVESRYRYKKKVWFSSLSYSIATYLGISHWSFLSFDPVRTIHSVKKGIWYYES